MPSKEKILISLNKTTYSKTEVQHLISSINLIESQERQKPAYLKKYDYFIYDSLTHSKPRPYVIVKVLKDTVIAIPLSSTRDALNLIPSRTRTLKEGYFSKMFITVKKEHVMDRWEGVYDNTKLVDKAVRELKKYLNENL